MEPTEGATGAGRDVVFYRNHNGLGMQPMKVD